MPRRLTFLPEAAILTASRRLRKTIHVTEVSTLLTDPRRLRGGSIDLPARGSAHAASGLELGGWAVFDGAEGERVEFVVSGVVRGSARLDLRREDVARHFGDDAAAEFCGFLGWVSLKPGDREIRVEAVRGDGERALLGLVRLEPGPEDRPAADRSLILMYHRIADVVADPWALAVSPARFAEQMQALRRLYSVVSLGQLTEGFLTGNRGAVAVTFDDGYADNLIAAKPLLEMHEIPATVFITTGAVGESQEFWWDELDRIFLEPGKLPESLRLSIDGQRFEADLGAASSYETPESISGAGWRFGRRPPSPRQALYARLWERLQVLDDLPRRRAIEAFREWSGAPSAARPSHRTLRPEELLALKTNGLIEIGAHTVTHPALSRLPIDAQRREIVASASALEAMLGRRPASFAYPYGDLAEETEVLVREAGFREAMTTTGATLDPSSDPMRLPRIQVNDWNGEEFESRLSSWFCA